MGNSLIYIQNGTDVCGNRIELVIINELIAILASEIKESQIESLKQEKKVETINKIDMKGMLIMPGIIDAHTHMRDPGITWKEDFQTGSRACAKGGITTFYDMPNTIPATVTMETLELKRQVAKEKSIINYGFHFGGSRNNNKDEIRKVLKRKKANTVKIFMNVTTGEMLIEDDEVLMDIFRNSDLILVHAENDMIDKAVNMNAKYGKGLYICHIASEEEMRKVIEAKRNPELNNEKHPVYVEVTPHHLFLNEGMREMNERSRKLLRVKPELRKKTDNEFLWEALNAGIIDTLGTDHAPHLKIEKLEKVTFGMPGVETSLALMLTAYNEGKISLRRIQEVMCEKPAEIMKIYKRGKLKEGYYADVIAIDLKKEWIAGKNDELESRCKWTPYEGWKLKGKNVMTIVNGKIVYRNGKIDDNVKAGKEVEFYE